MADRTVSVQLKLDAQGAITGITLLDSRMLKAGKSVTDLQRRATRTRTVMVQAFRQMGRAAGLFTKAVGGIRRALFTVRFLVLGFFIQQFVNRIVRPLIDAASDLDRVMFRLGAAVNAAQKRFGKIAGTTKDWFNQIKILRRESTQFSTRELAEVVAGVAELGRNFGITAEQGKLLSRRILDIAAATGRTLTDVITRLRSGFLGSTEAIEDLGINFKILRLQQEALLLGFRGQFQLLQDTEQAFVRFNVVMADTIELEGILDDVLGTVSGRMRALSATWSDFILILSQAFINTQFFRTLFEGINNIIFVLTNQFKKFSPAGETALAIINGLLGAFGAMFALLTKGSVLVAQFLKGEIDLSTMFTKIGEAVLKGFEGLQLDLSAFAADAASVFTDKFGKRLADPLPIQKGLDSLGNSIKSLLERFSGAQRGGALTGFTFLDPNLFAKDTLRLMAIISDLKVRINKELEEIRIPFIKGGMDETEQANALVKIADAFGELLAQENKLLSFQQTLADFNLVMGLTNGTIETSTITFRELEDALGRLGIAFEDLSIKSGGPIKRFKADIRGMIDISAQMTRLVAGSFQALGGLIADALRGVEDPLKKFAAAILNIVGDLAIQLGTMFIAWGFAVLAWQKSFANPIAAIAAGIALVTIGGAIKGFASSFSGSAAAGTTASTASAGPLEFTVPLSSISPRQGIAEDDRLTSTLNRLDDHFSRIEAQDGVLVVKDGVRRAGGINKLMTSDDRRQVTQSVLRQPTLNTF